MTFRRGKWSAVICLAVILVLPAAASAGPLGIDFQLDDSLSLNPGDTGTFYGSIENTGPDEVFLNGFSVTLASPDITHDDSPFFANVPLSLIAGGSTGVISLFDVLVALGALPGTYSGSATLLGGLTFDAFDELGTQDFDVVVTKDTAPAPVPEPGTLTLLGLGVAGIVARRHRRTATNGR